MSRIRSKGTGPEVVVRRLVSRLGFRYRLHRKDLPGTPDLVFAGRKKVIFIHGCFWHQHPGCRYAVMPKTNVEYWEKKLRRNAVRDNQAVESLNAAGWEVLIIWECETRNEGALLGKLQNFLSS